MRKQLWTTKSIEMVYGIQTQFFCYQLSVRHTLISLAVTDNMELVAAKLSHMHVVTIDEIRVIFQPVFPPKVRLIQLTFLIQWFSTPKKWKKIHWES
ncbi:hypothetical protein P781_14065 [Vibrio mimicus CAIM 1883]|nr:hypothetical protein P780_14050 [Vibrio mimicus CAIM 1882]ERM54368.1 hypothetical protein P781_14065 [Vibrio mimicus CAIM 1883]